MYIFSDHEQVQHQIYNGMIYVRSFNCLNLCRFLMCQIELTLQIFGVSNWVDCLKK